MPDLKSIKRRRQVLGAALIAPVLSLLILGIISHHLRQEGSETRKKVVAVDALRDHTGNLLVALLDNETGQRGYVLTEKEEFLEPFKWSSNTVPSLLENLDGKMPNPATAKSLQDVHASVDARLKFAAQTVEMERSGHHDQAVAQIATGRGKQLMDQARQGEAKLDAALAELRSAYLTQFLNLVALNEWVSWGLIAMDIIVAGALLLLFRYFRRNQAMLHICAWSKTVQFSGEWITFEEYLMRRFGMNVSHGMSPAEAKKFLAEREEA
jgi:CHASE3 domain sensor protein